MVGKVTEGGPQGLKKGSKVTKQYLDELPDEKWFEVRLRNDEANEQLEKARQNLERQREFLDGTVSRTSAKS